MTIFEKFLRDEAGAVTIDWVAITAGIAVFGVAIVYNIFTVGVTPKQNQIISDIRTEPLRAVVGTAPQLNP